LGRVGRIYDVHHVRTCARAASLHRRQAPGREHRNIARRQRRIVEETSVALQIALYHQHRRFLTACVPSEEG